MAFGQDLQRVPPRHPAKSLPMQSILYDAGTHAEQIFQAARATNQAPPIAELKKNMAGRGLRMRDDAKIQVEIVGPAGAGPIDPKVVAPLGGEITNTWQNRADLWVPAEALTGLARALPAGYFMERADPGYPDDVGGQGATAVNSDSYRDAGQNGAGLTIAVIDSGFANFTMARNAGDAPPAVRTVTINYAAAPWEDSNDTQHGTACVEAAFDHAPGANYRLYKTDSVTDLGTAVNDCIANGVDIITHSMSRYNTGWADNTGPACAAATAAANAGILFFTSAGNRAQQHWQGNFSDSDNDKWHGFSGNDETIDIVVAPNGGGSFFLQWAGASDYDFYLYDQDLTTVLASSTNGGNSNFESFTWTSPFGANRTVHLAVYLDGGSASQFEIFLHSSGTVTSFQYAMAAGSTTSPSNTTHPNVISVGAVAFNSWNSANGTTGIIANYSSQGPSNSGMTLPDICGPTNTTTIAYGGGFSGTSCSTPNCAGAACTFWDAHSGYGASAIRWLILEQADLWRDWGTSGNDNIYGRGGMLLIDYVANTRWVARGYNNVPESTTGPNYTLQAAYNQAPSSGRILIFPGGNYPEAANLTGTKNLSIQTVQNAANLGF